MKTINYILKRFRKQILFFCLFISLVMFCIMEQEMIQAYQEIEEIDSFRMFYISEELWTSLEEQYGEQTEEFYDAFTVRMMQTKFNPEANKKSLPKLFIKTGIFRSKYIEYKTMYQTILQGISCFPVAEDIKGGETVSFDDSWGGERTYGGNRQHEGCDIMTSNNKRGYFPIVSMTDGVVEKKGWLPQGGYRLGIRSASGAYFYYAHLHSYSEGIEEGTTVRAGDLIGFMGDTGYSEIEGTVGNFDVHLHMGIYIDYQGEEMSVNPYWVLKHYESKKRPFYNKTP